MKKKISFDARDLMNISYFLGELAAITNLPSVRNNTKLLDYLRLKISKALSSIKIEIKK